MKYCDNFEKLCAAFEGAGAFLVVEDKIGRVNVMTIGWGQVGIMWGLPIMTVLVRPARHTHAMLGNAAHFSVCVPRLGELKNELAYCGSKSGRDYDKARVCGFTLKDGVAPRLKYLAGCELVYQCEIYGRNELLREALAPGALGKYYPGADVPHTLYFGKILKAEKFR